MIGTQQEQLRQQYLAAMGVTLWLPRQVLSGAAASPRWRWQAAGSGAGVGLEVAVSEAVLNVSMPGPVANKAPLRELLQRPVTAEPAAAMAQQKASVEPVSLPVTTSPACQSAAVTAELQSSDAVEVDAGAQPEAGSKAAMPSVPRFRLALIDYGNCSVITELPTSQAQPWSGLHQRLLDAILAAVGLGSASQAPSGVSEFQWPLDPLARFDQSAPIARHALQVALAGVQQTAQSVLLLMGKSAQQYLLPPEQKAALGQLIHYQGRPALCCHGLNEVLRLPGLKAELWRQLQPLRNLPSGR